MKASVLCALMMVVLAAAITLVPALGAPNPAAPPAASGVEVKVALIRETRVKVFAADTTAETPTLELSLAITGDAAAKTTRYGKLKLEKAVDDKGTSLLEEKDPFGQDMVEGFVSVEKGFGPEIKNGFSLSLHLKPAKREAAKIAQIQGAFIILSGGKNSDVVIADVAAQAGKEVQDPALKAAGVSIKIESVKDKSISYTTSGKAEAFLEVALVDAAGKKVNASSSRASVNNGPVVNSLDVMGDMPAKIGLKVTLLTGTQALTVPLDLKDVPLP